MSVTKWILAVGAAGFLTASCVVPAQSQTAPKRPNAANGPMMRTAPFGRLVTVLSRLDLTPAQKRQVKAFTDEARAKAQAVRENNNLTPVQKRTRMQAITKTLREKITGILTTEQKTKLRRLMAAAPGPRPMLARWTAVLGKLDLTPAQKAQVRRFVQDAQTKANIVRDSNVEPARKRAQMQRIQNALRENIMGILTPEQKDKLKELLKQRPIRPAAPR